MDMRAPVILWLRRDLRLDDHPALCAALAAGGPVIPLFILDETSEGLGAAPKWRLGLALEALARDLERLGSALVLRRGEALSVLDQVIAETGAGQVVWTRYYEPVHIARDTRVKAALRARGIGAESHGGALLCEPGAVRTGAGQPYAVFAPFWRAIRGRDMGAPLPAPTRLPPPVVPVRSDRLADWNLGGAMARGAAVVRRFQSPGGGAALARLDHFIEASLPIYAVARDFPARPGRSGLSEHLAWGEISPRRIWDRVRAVSEMQPALGGACEKFLSELGWREFAWHLLAHNPDLARANWREGWQDFPWRGDNDDADAWRRGETGEPLVDAGLREMYVAGRMHNRVRMIAASYLTKHLLTDWRVGLAWFADCLADWDPAANALGWQWVAGCGPDAAPYFRIFNPRLQAAKFDPDGDYVRRFLDRGVQRPHVDSLAFYAAAPRAWGLEPGRNVMARITLDAGRDRALRAYQARGAGRSRIS